MNTQSEDEQTSAQRQRRTDWSGTLIGLSVAPVFFVFVYLKKAEMGFTVGLILCAAMVAIKLRWQLRRYAWFWVTVALVLVLQIPVLFIVRWSQTNVPTIAYSLPLGILEFLVVSGAIRLAEKAFSKRISSDGE